MSDRRVLVVTGASSGIGRALALAAPAGGFDVVLVARRTERLADLSRAIRDNGGACAFVAIDVTAREAPSRIVDAAMHAFDRIDVVVNNAGSGAYGGLLEQSDAALEAQWQLHVAAPLRIARAALAQLEKSHGQLLFVGSGIARIPLPGYGGYAIAKAAIRAAAIQLRRELSGRGVSVSYVDPGLVATEFHEAIGIERDNHVRPSTPEEVARNILHGIKRRKAAIAGSWWQTAGTALGEFAGTLADPTVRRLAPRLRTEPEPQPQEHALKRIEVPPATGLAQVLEPVARRMERVKLPESFVRSALVPGDTLELNELAMRWAGMPNKNERAAMHEVLDALTVGGYLEPTGEETWKVVRSAES